MVCMSPAPINTCDIWCETCISWFLFCCFEVALPLPLLSLYCDVILLLLLRFLFWFLCLCCCSVLNGMVLTWNEQHPFELYRQGEHSWSLLSACVMLGALWMSAHHRWGINNNKTTKSIDDDGCLSPRVRVCFPCDWWKLTIFQLAYNYNWLILSSGESVESQTTDRPHCIELNQNVPPKNPTTRQKQSASCSLSRVFLFFHRSQHTHAKKKRICIILRYRQFQLLCENSKSATILEKRSHQTCRSVTMMANTVCKTVWLLPVRSVHYCVHWPPIPHNSD